MTHLPAGIEVVEFHEGPRRLRRYRLPRQNLPGLGCMIGVGLLALALTGGFLCFLAFAGLEFAQGDLRDFPLAFLVPLCFIALVGFPFALFMLLRRLFVHLAIVEISVSGERLLIVHRWGIARWTRRLPLQGLRGFRVTTDRPVNPRDPRSVRQASQVATLLADYREGRARSLCWGYPADFLEQLGKLLMDELSREPGSESSLLPVTSDNEFTDQVSSRGNQPSNSTAVVRSQDDQLIVDLSRASIWRCINPAVLSVLCIWNGLLAFVAGVQLISAISVFAGNPPVGDPGDESTVWQRAMFSIPFYAIGAGSLIYWFAMSRRWSRIVVSPEQLQVSEQKLWQTKTTSWPVDQIADVRAWSQVHEGEETLTWSHGLAIEPREGIPFKFLDWRPKSEVEWLATLLRRALHLPDEKAEEKPASDQKIPS